VKYILLLVGLVMFAPSLTSATEIVDTLDKTFKTISYPEEEVVVRIAIKTQVYEERGERVEETWLQSMMLHRKLLSVMLKNGWKQEDPLQVDTVNVGDIQLETGRGMTLKLKETLRLKAFLSPCDNYIVKYRGGDLNNFFQKTVIEKTEYCFTYDEHLQGKNYPY